MTTEDLTKRLKAWRRDFHKHPEVGFLEMRTASLVARHLSDLGFSLQLGEEVMEKSAVMGRPTEREIEEQVRWAKDHGADEEFLPYFQEGYTGIVATLETGREGPTVAFRVDMDALPIHETEKPGHVPNQEGFRSIVPGKMHACGHDAHTAIGLGLATLLKEQVNELSGTIKLIFQPAEEGTRGAKAMAEAGVVDDDDYFIASHIGMDVPLGHFVASDNGFLATTKMDVTFKGRSSHAGGAPEERKDVVLAAVAASLNIRVIRRLSAGASRVNVGELHAGSGRNIIPDKAEMIIEMRGETSEINEYVKEQVESVLRGAATMYNNEVEIEIVGEALNSRCSKELAEIIHNVAGKHPFIEETVLENSGSSGSEDATYFMEAVKKRGGLATYVIFGTDLAAGHHHEEFDINEEVLLPAVEVLYGVAKKLGEK